ncbi:MAG: hypothetical protein ABR985_08655 [Methanotrichaceae archaeon]|jgi:hypothetical protein
MKNTIRKLTIRTYQRKLTQRNQKFGTITVPVDVLSHWAGVESVRMEWDETLNVLFVCPQPWTAATPSQEKDHV